MKKTKKPKKKTTSQLKKELDNVFSQYIRNIYSKDGKVACYTCGIVKEFREIQNGHFVSRSYLATRFDENNCRPQCVGCNLFGGGRTAIFATKLEEEGIDTKTLYRKAQQITKDFPYQEKIAYYKALLKE